MSDQRETQAAFDEQRIHHLEAEIASLRAQIDAAVERHKAQHDRMYDAFKRACEEATLNRNAMVAAQAERDKLREQLDKATVALKDIAGWKNDTLGPRPKEFGPFDCDPSISSAFDRGVRMAFYRCADRAMTAISSLSDDSRQPDPALKTAQGKQE